MVLFHIAMNPGCTIPEIADGLCLTQRTIWGAVGDLRRAGMLEIERRGRRHYYSVNMKARFRAPTIDSVTLGTLFGGLERQQRLHVAAAN
jgi:DNA-binding MarR family transcriptional regulator